MKKFFIGLLIGCLLTTFICVNLFDAIHVEMERLNLYKVCGNLRVICEWIFGETLSDALYRIYKIFQLR